MTLFVPPAFFPALALFRHSIALTWPLPHPKFGHPHPASVPGMHHFPYAISLVTASHPPSLPPSPLHFRLVLAQHTLSSFWAFLGPFRIEAWIISDPGLVLHLLLNAAALLFARSTSVSYSHLLSPAFKPSYPCLIDNHSPVLSAHVLVCSLCWRGRIT